MTDRLIAIKITSDGKAFVVDQAANAEAVKKLGKEADVAGDQVEKLATRTRRAAKQVKEDLTELPKATEPIVPAVKRAEEQIRKLGATSAATAQQMRMVAPQVTDMVTQLAGGQNPLQILIQQGGQLKDVFGGVGPAARALGGYIGGMINPLTVTAGAVGILGFAWHKANEEAAGFAKQVVLSGNAPGATISQYHAIADGLASIGGSKGAALDAITSFAQAGKVGADELQRYTGIGQQLERLVGKPVADTAKEFGALAEAPVSASLKLTETYNYLTSGVYQQIKALDDQGKHTEAVRLAQETFANSLDLRMPQMVEHLGTLEKLWLKIKGAVSGSANAVNTALSPATLSQQISTLRDQIAGRQERNASLGIKSGQGTEDLRLQLAYLQEQARLEQRSADIATDRLDKTKARAVWDKGAEESLSRQEKLARAIARTEAEGVAAGATRVEIERRVANERKKFIDTDAVAAEQDKLSARITALRRAGELIAIDVKAAQEAVAAHYKLGVINHTEYITALAANDIKLLQNDRETLAQQIEFARQKKNNLREVSDLQGQLAVKDREILAREKKAEADILTAHLEKVRAARQFYQNELNQWEADRNSAASQEDQRWDAAQRSAKEYFRALSDDNDDLQYQATLMGKSAVEQARMNEQRRINLALRQEERRIDAAAEGGNISGARRDELMNNARTAATEASAQAATKVWIEEWRKANDTVANGLYDILLDKGKNAGDKLASVFEQLVLRPTIIASLQGVSGTIASMVTGGGPGSQDGGGMNGMGALPGMNWMSNFGGSFGNAVNQAGGRLFNAGFENIGATMIEGSDAIGRFAGMAGDAFGYINALSSAGEGKWGKAIGTAVGTYFGGPIGSMIGSTIGSMVDSAFGGGGGPKSEGGYGYGVGNIGDSKNAQNLAKSAVSTFAGAARQFGSKNVLDAGVLYSQDPEGDAKTQLQVAGTINGQEIYNRFKRTGGLENVERGDDALKAEFATELLRITIAGLAKSDIPDELKNFFNSVDLNADGATLQAAIDTAATVKQFRDMLVDLGSDFQYLSNMGIEASKAFIDAAGGLDVLRNNLGTFYANFYSEEEKRKQTAANIARVVNGAGGSLSQDQVLGADKGVFRALVEAAALRTDEQGKKLYVALLSVSGAFASIQVDAKEAAAALKNLEEARKKETDAAVSALEKAIANERKLRQARLQVAQQAVQELSGVFVLLKDNVTSLRGETVATRSASASRGQAYIDQALRSARAGYAPDQVGLSDAIGAARAGIDNSHYTTQQDEDFARMVLAGKLAAMQEITGTQLSTAEQQLQAQQAAVDSLEKMLEDEKAALDYARNGVDATLSVVAAVERLHAAMFKEASGAASGTSQAVGSGAVFGAGTAAASGVTSFATAGGATGNSAGSLMFSNGLAFDFAAFAMDNLQDPAAIADKAKSLGLNESDIAQLMNKLPQDVETWFSLQGVPKFNRGANRIPQTMLGLLHPDEAVVPAAFNPWAGGQGMGGGGDAVAREIRDMNLTLGGLLTTIGRQVGTSADVLSEIVNGRPLTTRAAVA